MRRRKLTAQGYLARRVTDLGRLRPGHGLPPRVRVGQGRPRSPEPAAELQKNHVVIASHVRGVERESRRDAPLRSPSSALGRRVLAINISSVWLYLYSPTSHHCLSGTSSLGFSSTATSCTSKSSSWMVCAILSPSPSQMLSPFRLQVVSSSNHHCRVGSLVQCYNRAQRFGKV